MFESNFISPIILLPYLYYRNLRFNDDVYCAMECDFAESHIPTISIVLCVFCMQISSNRRHRVDILL